MTAAGPGKHAVRYAFVAMLALVFLAYGNHFDNAFHFDDFHTILENPYIRDLRNIPHFFTDSRTFSTLPANRSYRPLVTASLAVDYWLGHGLQPLWFHISTFFWFLVQLCVMFPLYRRIVDRARPGSAGTPPSANLWTALFATALYAVHPVTAETVNYIIQRGDLYATLGVVGGLLAYILAPGARRFGLYLIPVVAGVLSKPTATAFPALLFGWLWLFDEIPPARALIRTLPALIVTGAAAWFVVVMTGSSYVAGASSVYGYRLTQPAVLLGYFRKFFIPTDLSADTDRPVLTSISHPDVICGFLFVLALVGFAAWCSRKRELRPLTFGLGWFLVTSIPTSWIALSEVENDHRMYLPFVGLALAVCWAAALWLDRSRVPARIVALSCLVILIVFAAGTRARNRVWHTEESLWYDVTVKSPNNGRGLMNYGLTLMSQGRTSQALDYFRRGEFLLPNYSPLQINLGIANGALGNASEAEPHFLRAIRLAPADASAQFYYARWLLTVNRRNEAVAHLLIAAADNPDYLAARYLLMDTYAAAGDADSLRREARSILSRFPSDSAAASWLARASTLPPPARPGAVPLPPRPTADDDVALSLAFYRAGNYPACIAAAREALKLRPEYAEAWNNIGAAYNAMSQWDQGIAAEKEALRLKPDLELARNNLALALGEKAKLSAARASH